MNKANNTGEWEEIFDNAQTMHLQEFINHYSLSTETGQQWLGGLLGEEFKPYETITTAGGKPQEGQDELYPIEFIEWLCGGSESYIKDSYELYKKDIEKGQP